MRRILITLAILIACVAAVSATWIFRGRQISLFIDRFGTIETNSARIHSIAYEGSGTGGILHINDLALGLNDKNGPIPNIGSTKDGQLGLAAGGKVFPFGPPRSEAENLAAVPPAGDDVALPRPPRHAVSAPLRWRRLGLVIQRALVRRTLVRRHGAVAQRVRAGDS